MIKCDIPSRLMATTATAHNLGVRLQATDDAVEVFIHGVVGDPWDGGDSKSVNEMLSMHKGKPVTVRVNSPGGLAYDGVAIFNAIDAHDGPTVGVIEGMAGSAASLIVMACDTVRCHKTAVFHPHYSLIMAMGHQADIREALAIQEQLDKDLEEVYAEVSGRSIEQVQSDLMGPNGDGTRFSATAAMEAGYVDEVIEHNKRKTHDNMASHAQRANLARCKVALAKLR